MQAKEVEQLLEKSFPEAELKVFDMTGGGDHFEVHLTSSKFSGKNLMQQHKMVYEALGETMNGPIHALKLHTKAPDIDKESKE